MRERGHPVIRGHSMRERGHPVIRGHSMRGHPVIRGHSMRERTPCDQGTLGTFRSLHITVGWPLKSCTHTGIFPSVSGHPTVQRRLQKVPNFSARWPILPMLRNLCWRDTPRERGHPVIRGHSTRERTPCDQGTLHEREDTLWSGDTLLRGHPVIRGHSVERTPCDQGNSVERTPCDQGTLCWEDTLWSGDVFSARCPIFPMLRNLCWRDTPRERGHPVIRGRFLSTVSYLPHVKEPVMKGHLSCRDILSGILRGGGGTSRGSVGSKTGFTVLKCPWRQVLLYMSWWNYVLFSWYGNIMIDIAVATWCQDHK